MSKKEKAKRITEMMREHTNRYGFPTKPKDNKNSDSKKNDR